MNTPNAPLVHTVCSKERDEELVFPHHIVTVYQICSPPHVHWHPLVLKCIQISNVILPFFSAQPYHQLELLYGKSTEFMHHVSGKA